MYTEYSNFIFCESIFDSALDFGFYIKFYHIDVVIVSFIYSFLFYRWPTMFSPTRSWDGKSNSNQIEHVHVDILFRELVCIMLYVPGTMYFSNVHVTTAECTFNGYTMHLNLQHDPVSELTLVDFYHAHINMNWR